MAGCCGGNESVVMQVKKSLGLLSNQPESEVKNMSGLIRMEYTGQNVGAIAFTRVNGQQLTRTYRGGANPSNKYVDALKEDAELLEQTGKWRVAKPKSGIDLQQMTSSPTPATYGNQGSVNDEVVTQESVLREGFPASGS